MNLVFIDRLTFLYSAPVGNVTRYIVIREDVPEVVSEGRASCLSYVFEEEVATFFVPCFGGGESSLPSIQIRFMVVFYEEVYFFHDACGFVTGVSDSSVFLRNCWIFDICDGDGAD